jgi:hypothetical protein
MKLARGRCGSTGPSLLATSGGERVQGRERGVDLLGHERDALDERREERV